MADVRGLGDDAPAGWVLEEYTTPMPKGRKAILEEVGKIFLLGKVQSIRLEVGKPIAYTMFIKEDEATQRRFEEQAGGMTVGEVARNIEMIEYEGDLGEARLHSVALIRMFLSISARGLFLTHIGVGMESRFFDWIDMDKLMFGGIESFAGARLIYDKNLPDDALILFGGPHPGGRTDQITFAVKCHLFSEEDIEEVTDEQDHKQAAGSGDRPGERSEADGAVEDDSPGLVKENRRVQPRKGRRPARGPRAAAAPSASRDSDGRGQDRREGKSGDAST